MDESSSIAAAIQSLFKTAYETLEQIQEYADHIEPFSDSIVACHWAISNLEKINRIYAQSPYSTLAQDAFSLRGNLERFIASCHALIRFVELLNLHSDGGVGCFIGAGNVKATLKRKQVRELQQEFWDHQRLLSLVLANAIYMTTLDMQKENAVPDPELDVILRQSQKRHTVYEKVDRLGHEHKSQKPAESHVEQLEWEVCLRKYFDYVEKQVRRSEEAQRRQSAPLLSQETSLVRHQGTFQSEGVEDWRRTSRRYSSSNGRKLLTYGTSMEGHSYNEIYTRPRRNSTASRASSANDGSRNNSFSSAYSVQPVLTPNSQPSPTLSPSHQWDDNAISPGSYPSPNIGAPSTGETLSRAWKDIVNATQTMPTAEARAYIEGRLAGLDASTITEIRKAMSFANMGSPAFTASTTDLPTAKATWEASSAPVSAPTSRYARRRSLDSKPALTSSQSLPVIKTTPAVSPPARATSEPIRAKGIKKPSLHRQKRLSGARTDYARQLSTIVERPSTSRSRPESVKSRKSIFSLKKEIPPPLQEKPELPAIDRKASSGSNVSSDSSTLRGSTPEKEKRIIELEEVPEEPGSLPIIKNNRRGASNAITSKPLPMTPADLLHPDTSSTPANSSVKSRITRLFSRRTGASLPSTKSTPSLSTGHPGMKSHETLGHLSNASLECLRKGGMNGSRSTLLVAYQETPDQPFQIWLNALPYIEGRTTARV